MNSACSSALVAVVQGASAIVAGQCVGGLVTKTTKTIFVQRGYWKRYLATKNILQVQTTAFDVLGDHFRFGVCRLRCFDALLPRMLQFVEHHPSPFRTWGARLVSLLCLQHSVCQHWCGSNKLFKVCQIDK